MFKTIHLDVRGGAIKRYVLRLKGKNNRYYSISIENVSFENRYKTLLDPLQKFSVEICRVEKPYSWTFHTLISTTYRNSDSVISYLTAQLVRVGAIDAGVPVIICFTLDGTMHSWTVMNPGLNDRQTGIESRRHLQLVPRLA